MQFVLNDAECFERFFLLLFKNLYCLSNILFLTSERLMRILCYIILTFNKLMN